MVHSEGGKCTLTPSQLFSVFFCLFLSWAVVLLSFFLSPQRHREAIIGVFSVSGLRYVIEFYELLHQVGGFRSRLGDLYLHV